MEIGTLKSVSFKSLTRRMLFLDKNATLEEYDDFVSLTWKSGSTYNDWLNIADRLNVKHYMQTLKNVCLEECPTYSWSFSQSISWDVWCFSVARWIRNNDVTRATDLPVDCGLDYRHAYAITGKSGVKNQAYVRRYLDSNAERFPCDWGEMLTCKDMWDEMIFYYCVDALGVGTQDKCARMYDIFVAAMRNDNYHAISAIFDILGYSISTSGFWRQQDMNSNRDSHLMVYSVAKMAQLLINM